MPMDTVLCAPLSIALQSTHTSSLVPHMSCRKGWHTSTTATSGHTMASDSRLSQTEALNLLPTSCRTWPKQWIPSSTYPHGTIRKPIDKQNDGTKTWEHTSGHGATTGKTTGLASFSGLRCRSTTPSPLPPVTHHSPSTTEDIPTSAQQLTESTSTRLPFSL